jgi:YebC/PmpR family DNA-binding regulatory protein
MSGHSKWANIKRDKAVNDAKRSQLFTKVSRLVSVAVRQSGGDPDSNAALRLAIEKAKDARMPKENIERAIKKGIGTGGGGGSFEEVIYEGFGPHGEAFLVKAVTDNKNRTVAEIRNIFDRAGGSLGSAGCTHYIFSPDPKSPNFMVETGSKDLYEQLEEQDDVCQVYVNFPL